MKKYNKIVVFMVALFIFSMITGFIYGINNSGDISSYINSLSNKNSVIIKDFFIVLVSFFLTLSIVGVFLEFLYIGFEGISVGFIVANFYKAYKLKGLCFSIIWFLVNKLFYVIILIMLFMFSYYYIVRIKNNFLGKVSDYNSILIRSIVKKYIILLIFLMVYDLFIFFFGNNVLKYFTFML